MPRQCLEGTTTPNGTVGAISKDNCTVLIPGYGIPTNPVPGVTKAYQCPQDSWRAGEVPGLSTSSPEVPCIPCGHNTVTMPNTTAATTPDVCLAPPGFGWAMGGDYGAGNATICPLATYNSGYNRKPCTLCGGEGITTVEPGALFADQCMTPAGYGNEQNSVTLEWRAFPCPIGSYGRPNGSFGLVEIECVKVGFAESRQPKGRRLSAFSEGGCLIASASSPVLAHFGSGVSASLACRVALC